ncbi:MAG: preprotein translocase subunit SecG, partial [Acetobacteraceae bacterium]
MLFSILIAVMVILGIVLVALILLQQGKGADAGAAFGSGASGTVFGARGSGSFLSRTTGVLMALFMILAVVMAWLGQHGAAKPSSLMAQQPPVAARFDHDAMVAAYEALYASFAGRPAAQQRSRHSRSSRTAGEGATFSSASIRSARSSASSARPRFPARR